MTRRFALLLPMLTACSRFAAAFQGQKKRISPHETVSTDLGGKTITITYGRPYLKGRQVGKEVAPVGEVWRLGADEATKITVTANTQIGSALRLAPGSYALFAITGPKKWTLIVNKTADQWGAFNYESSQDLGRVDLPVEKSTSPVEEFTISLNKKSNDAAELKMAWGKESVTVPVKVL